MCETFYTWHNERYAERIALELALLQAIHTVAQKYLDEEEKTARFFA